MVARLGWKYRWIPKVGSRSVTAQTMCWTWQFSLKDGGPQGFSARFCGSPKALKAWTVQLCDLERRSVEFNTVRATAETMGKVLNQSRSQKEILQFSYRSSHSSRPLQVSKLTAGLDSIFSTFEAMGRNSEAPSSLGFLTGEARERSKTHPRIEGTRTRRVPALVAARTSQQGLFT